MAIPVRNTDGWTVGAQMINATTGADFAGTVTVYVTIDDGPQAIGSVGSGLATLRGHGYYTYSPAVAETDGDIVAFTFVGINAISASPEFATITAAL